MKASSNQNAILSRLVSRAEEFARQILLNQPDGFSYHSLAHTALVVENARAVARNIELPDREVSLLLAAAWLHDIGIGTMYFGHELQSCAIARHSVFQGLDQGSIEAIEQAIMATQIPQRAQTPIGEVLCDADLLYMSGTNFFLWSDRLREEHDKILNKKYSNPEWLDFNIQFVRKHRYYTPFVQERYNEGLAKNLKELERRRTRLR